MRVRLKTLIARWEEREGKRLTYAQIAEETGISRNTLSSLALNQSTRVDFNTIEALCDFFNCEVGELLVLVDTAA